MPAPPLAISPLMRLRLDDGLNGMQIDLDARQSHRLLQFVVLLEKWNKVYNLTAIRDPERMIGLHILDSLSVLPQFAECKSVLDVGTGGGLPGIPLAIAKPDLQVTMLDTVAKKTAFVRQAISELALENAGVVTARVESYNPLAKFDRVISRAFAELKDFIEGAGHLCADNGAMLAMKGVYPHDEIGRLPPGFIVKEIIALNIPGVVGERHLVVIKKF